MKVKPKLVIGLGNPCKEYEKTYHNVGFLMLDYLKNKYKEVRPPQVKNNIRRSNLPNIEFIKTNRYILLKPLTFMNESGKAVKEAIKHFKAKPEEILVVHDDSDIEFGKYKVSFGRGSAGHRGVESIIKSLGTKNFWRLRIGIRRRNTQKDTQNYAEKQRRAISRRKAGEIVLKKINKKDLEILEKIFQTIKDEININNNDQG